MCSRTFLDRGFDAVKSGQFNWIHPIYSQKSQHEKLQKECSGGAQYSVTVMLLTNLFSIEVIDLQVDLWKKAATTALNPAFTVQVWFTGCGCIAIGKIKP